MLNLDVTPGWIASSFSINSLNTCLCITWPLSE